MAVSDLARKLRIPEGARALIMNAPQGYAELLGELPTGVEVSLAPDGKHGFVHLFVKDVAEWTVPWRRRDA